jgi:hypothetical protein
MGKGASNAGVWDLLCVATIGLFAVCLRRLIEITWPLLR